MQKNKKENNMLGNSTKTKLTERGREIMTSAANIFEAREPFLKRAAFAIENTRDALMSQMIATNEDEQEALNYIFKHLSIKKCLISPFRVYLIERPKFFTDEFSSTLDDNLFRYLSAENLTIFSNYIERLDLVLFETSLAIDDYYFSFLSRFKDFNAPYLGDCFTLERALILTNLIYKEVQKFGLVPSRYYKGKLRFEIYEYDLPDNFIGKYLYPLFFDTTTKKHKFF